MSEYEPELGQAIFGQPFKQFSVEPYIDAALTLLRHEVERIQWNEFQERRDPFGNTAEEFDCDGAFQVKAYSWNEDIEQPWNFKWKDIEISWYKYLGRGMSINREVTPDEAALMLRECLDACKAWEKKRDKDGILD